MIELLLSLLQDVVFLAVICQLLILLELMKHDCCHVMLIRPTVTLGMSCVCVSRHYCGCLGVING